MKNESKKNRSTESATQKRLAEQNRQEENWREGEEQHQKEVDTKKAPPTPMQVREWIKRDLEAAIYFLNHLAGSPDLLNKITNEIHEAAIKGSPKLPD